MADTDPALLAKLNEVVDVLGAISSGRLREVLGRGRGFNPVAGCDSECGCRGGMCGCNGVVSANERFGFLSFPEFMAMREARVQELRAELDKLQLPKQLDTDR